jgi:hypothetical protein
MSELPQAEIARTKFYFAFPDRAYHYDCAQCSAICCRGHGIGTAARETPALLSHYPELAFTATKSGQSGSNFTNPAGGCFFLTEKNLCQVEQDHGRAAKPGVCVAFPFNDFSRIGNVVVVRPHFLCPLRLLPGKGTGNHAELEKMLHETGVVSRALRQPGPDLSEVAALEVIQREEAFRDKCGSAIGLRAFDELLGQEEEDKTEHQKWRERALRLWGIPSLAAPRVYLDDILLALAPPLRMRIVLLTERQRLRILALAGAYLRNVARITSRPLTLQGSHQMIVNVLGVLRLFATGNVSLRLSAPEATQGVDFQNPELTLAFFQVLEELQGGRKLFDALDDAVPMRLSDIERTIFFHQLARRIRVLKRGDKCQNSPK